ncbi:MAG: prepilin peptidase [Bdellovibrionia bacterium]
MLSLAVPSLILLAGVVDDLRSRKVHNELVLVCLVVALIFCLYEGGLAGIGAGFLGLAAAVLMTLPLVLFGALGAGDMKIFMAFGMAATWEASVSVGIAALIWGLVFGVIRAIIAGQFKALMLNTIGIAARKPAGELHRIPYTVALFMGWLTYLADGRIS